MITQRLVLEPLSTQDNDFMYELVNSKGWIEFIGNRNVNSSEEAIPYIQKIIENADVTYWVVKLKKERISLGVITLLKRDYLEHHDIGFAFLPQYMNNGYAYEAANTVLGNLVKDSKHTHIQATTLPSNKSSIQLLEKLGLRFKSEMEVKGEKLYEYIGASEKLAIDKITRDFFSAFTNKGNRQPDLERLKHICIAEVLIINRTGLKSDVYDLNSFIEPRQKLLTDGTLIEFVEAEISEETKIVNNIAQRYTEYAKSGILEGVEFKQRGYKLFQFYKLKQEWKISSVVWEDKN